MKGFIHIESTDKEGALRCEANLSDVSLMDRMQALDAACKLLKIDSYQLGTFVAARLAGVFEQSVISTGGADVSLGDINELMRQYREMKKEDNENGNGEKM